MYDRKSGKRLYTVGYFARKHDLERGSARLILGLSRDTRDANRRARAIKFRSKGKQTGKARTSA